MSAWQFFRRLLLLNLVLTAIAIPAGLLGSYEDPSRWYREGRLMTWLSFVQIIMAGCLAHQLYLIRRAGPRFDWKEQASVWRLAAIGFFFLALDEMFRIHQAIDRYGHRLLGLEITDLSDRADDLLVGLYGVIGIAVLLYYRREFFRFRRSFGWFGAGFVTFFLMVTLDVVVNGDDWISAFLPARYLSSAVSWFSTLEDTLKQLGEVFFVCAFARCLEIAKQARIESQRANVVPMSESPCVSHQYVVNQ